MIGFPTNNGGLFGTKFPQKTFKDQYGMMSPGEISRMVREREERDKKLAFDLMGETVDQEGGQLFGSGGTLLGTMETGLGGVSVLNTNKSDLAQAQAKAQEKIDKMNEGRSELGQPLLTAEEEDRLYGEQGVSRVNGQFTYYK
tara:strand:+ start:1469 stop:1897 length:429 start_codon:yes stop_codon:yes gene_type:complete